METTEGLTRNIGFLAVGIVKQQDTLKLNSRLIYKQNIIYPCNYSFMIKVVLKAETFLHGYICYLIQHTILGNIFFTFEKPSFTFNILA